MIAPTLRCLYTSTRLAGSIYVRLDFMCGGYLVAGILDQNYID